MTPAAPHIRCVGPRFSFVGIQQIYDFLGEVAVSHCLACVHIETHTTLKSRMMRILTDLY